MLLRPHFSVFVQVGSHLFLAANVRSDVNHKRMPSGIAMLADATHVLLQ